ncbi:transcriptional regulator BetI [Acuticoccus sp. MNP-M23]|uniref:transcriptional regulator BetI n=1 Tax=Acuticoccus sp. MNP-M23 TaxID=3072793 RepID=UPI0028154D27|nr:transcriptional regulator BetI [Acuticoccus sp. MNP-M23]WMS42667.1 transcriptional regulator BetI [Acuticoccus sp. MNP-M23]
MPKVGMEPLRRDALIRAAIAEVGAAGSLDVTVQQIAKRAGMSPALAHHYFGSKDRIFIAAMRRILDEFGQGVRRRYRTATGPRARISAIVDGCFSPEQFDPATVMAWLTFYVQAHRTPEAARLLSIYARRLDANLVYALRQLTPGPAARRIAEGTAAMIDGFYIRAALDAHTPDPRQAIDLVEEYVTLCLAKEAA